MSIRLRNGDVRIRAVDSDRVTIREVDGHDLSGMFAVVLGEGNVSLRSTRDGGGSTPDLEIELPRRATLVVETTSGDIDVDGLAGDQRYRTASGEVRLRAVTNRIAVEAVSGDIDVVATGEAEVSVRTVSGDVALRAATLRSLQATTTSGDLKVAGRLLGPGPFRIETVERRHAPGAGRRRAGRDGHAERRPRVRARRPDREPPGASLAAGRQRRAAGRVPFDVRRPQRRPTDRRAGPYDPGGEAAPDPSAIGPDTPTERVPTPRRPTAPSPQPTRTPGCGSCARSSAARSTSRRRASGSRRSIADRAGRTRPTDGSTDA